MTATTQLIGAHWAVKSRTPALMVFLRVAAMRRIRLELGLGRKMYVSSIG